MRPESVFRIGLEELIDDEVTAKFKKKWVKLAK